MEEALSPGVRKPGLPSNLRGFNRPGGGDHDGGFDPVAAPPPAAAPAPAPPPKKNGKKIKFAPELAELPEDAPAGPSAAGPSPAGQDDDKSHKSSRAFKFAQMRVGRSIRDVDAEDLPDEARNPHLYPDPDTDDLPDGTRGGPVRAAAARAAAARAAGPSPRPPAPVRRSCAEPRPLPAPSCSSPAQHASGHQSIRHARLGIMSGDAGRTDPVENVALQVGPGRAGRGGAGVLAGA
jgi:hypothetical protein